MATPSEKLVTFEYVVLGSAVTSVILQGFLKGLLWWEAALCFGIAISFLGFLHSYEQKIFRIRSLNSYQWEFRPGSTPGLWCCCLLPLCILLSCYSNQKICSDVHRITSFMAVGLVGSSILLLHSISQYFVPPRQDTPQPKDGSNTDSNHCSRPRSTPSARFPLFTYGKFQVAALSFVSGLAFSRFGSADIYYSLFISFLVHSIFYGLVISLPRLCPCSFTLGEVILLAQGVALFIISSILDVLKAICEVDKLSEMYNVYRFSEVVLLNCVFLIALQVLFQRRNASVELCAFFGIAVIIWMVILLYNVLHQQPVFWIIKYIFFSKIRVLLLCSWFFLFALAVVFVARNQNRKEHATTIQRKYFHGLLLLVYIPGLFYDVSLLYLASCGALFIFIILEGIRISNFAYLGQILHHSLVTFLDEKDQGVLILTPIYLLVGCSLPLWIQPNPMTQEDNRIPIALLSGLLTVGIGDAAAAIGGTLIGRFRWPGSSKTLEGTTISILVQLTFVWLLGISGLLIQTSISIPVVIAITLSSILEAVTYQIDNLILPLFIYPLLLYV